MLGKIILIFNISGGKFVITLWVVLILFVVHYEIAACFFRRRYRKSAAYKARYERRCREFRSEWINICRLYTDTKFKTDKTVSAFALYNEWTKKVPELDVLKSKTHQLNISKFLSKEDLRDLENTLSELNLYELNLIK